MVGWEDAAPGGAEVASAAAAVGEGDNDGPATPLDASGAQARMIQAPTKWSGLSSRIIMCLLLDPQ